MRFDVPMVFRAAQCHSSSVLLPFHGISPVHYLEFATNSVTFLSVPPDSDATVPLYCAFAGAGVAVGLSVSGKRWAQAGQRAPE